MTQITKTVGSISRSRNIVESEELKSDRQFSMIASFSMASAFGALLGSLESLRKDATGFWFQFSFGTLTAFAIGAAVGFFYWKLVVLDSSGARFVSPLRRALSLLLMLGGVAAFLYPLRFLPADKLPEVIRGLVTAVIALSIVGIILWQIKGALDQDVEQEEISAKAFVNPKQPME